jgi:hypothetical protein
MDGSPASLIGNMYIEESVVNRSGWINTTGVGSDKRMDWRGVTANSTTPAIITGTVGQPLVITWPNSAARHGSGNYIFNSPGGNIQYGQVQEQIESFPAGVWYYAYNNDFNSFNISTVSISRQGDVHSSTLVTNITTGDLKVGYGVWRNDNQATVPTGTVINSISPDFTVTGNLTQDNTVITGFSNTTGIYIGSVVHGAHVWANVTAVTATTLTVDQPPSSTVIGESMLVSPNAFVMNNSAVFTGSTYLTFIPTPDFVKFSGNEVSPNVLTQMIIGPNGRLHNLYFNGTLIVGDPGSNPGPLYVRGNILSQEGSPGAIQFRAGTNMEDNAFLLEVAGHNCGNPEPNRDNYVTNNVYMDPLENYPSTYVQACSIGMTDYNSDRFNLSVTHLSGNIIAHNLSPTTTNTLGHLCEIADGTFCNYSNNIIYDWGLETDIPHSQGGVVSGTITAGGFGYTATSSAVTGISLDGSMTTALNGAGDVILKLATIPQAIAWFGRIYITGTNIPEIDNKTWGCVWQWGAASNYDQSHICLTGSHPIASLAGWSGGGTAWFPVTGANVDGTLFKYDYYYFTYDTTSPTGPAPGGGNYRSGTGASSQFIVGPGGAIVDVTLGGSDHWNGGASLMQPGQNFRVNEIITAPIPGGSGFKFRLDKVSQVIDQGGNVFRRLGNPHSSWPHPEYTTGTYMDSVTGTGGHKTIDFINAAMDNEKRNWNPALTANKGHNPYIRAAFGVGIYVPPIILSPALLPPGSVNVPYSQLVTAANGTAPYTFAITAGALPNGLILDSNGLIHGTPTLAGNFNVTITATDAVSATGFTAYSMNIDPNQPQQGYHRIALTVTAG